MADSFSEFLAEHRAEHRSAFNRWCLTLGDGFLVMGALSVAGGHWRGGGLTVVVGLGVTVAGHVRDRNLPRALETIRVHPIWNIGGDISIAKDVLADAGRSRRRIAPLPE